MLFKHSIRGVGVCHGYAKGINIITILFLKLVCFLKIKIKIDYFIKENFEGWKKEDYGKTYKVTPIKIFLFKNLNKDEKIGVISNYIINWNKKLRELKK